MDVTLDSSFSNVETSSSSSSAGLTSSFEHEQPRVRLKIRGKSGKVLNSVCLFRNVYRIGSQENLVDLRLKSRGVRPLHAILIVERDGVMLMPFEHAPITIPDAYMNMIPIDHDHPVHLHHGQSFDIVGVRFTMEDIRPGDSDVHVPPGVVPIEDLPTRFPDPPMSGRSSPARNRTPRKMAISSHGTPGRRFTSQTSIASLGGAPSEDFAGHEDLQPLDSTPSPSKKRPRSSAPEDC